MKRKNINRKQTCTLAGLAALLCLALPAAMAQAERDGSMAGQVAVDADSSVFKLGTVSVYGFRETDAEKAESVVDREEINLLEKKDIGTALSLVPGVFHNGPQGNSNRYESDVKVRGYDLRSVPIFLDGIPVSIPYDGYSDLGRFTTGDVASIHVAKGYSSVMYGHNTLGGAINIVSMRPRSELDANATVGIGTGGMSEVSANVGTLQDKWYLQAGASNYARDYTKLSEAYVGKDADGNMVDSDRYGYRTRDRRGSVKIGYIPNATDEYALSYAKQEAVKKPDGSHGFRPTIWEWPKWDRETVSFVSNTRFLDNKFYIKPRVYYDTFKNTMDWWRGFPRGSHYDDKAFGASVEVGTEVIDNHLIKAMISLKDEEHREYNTDIHTGVKLSGTDEKVKQKFFSVALEDTYSISRNWEAQVGAIYTRRTADADAMGLDVTNLIGKYPEAGSMLSPTIDTFDPQLAVFYKPGDADTFRASISKKTRFPSFKQVYSNYGSGATAKCPPGSTTCAPGSLVPALALQNPGLSPEKALHYELGYLGVPLPGLHVEGSVYYSRAKDAIGRTDRDFTTFPGYAVTQSINLAGVTEHKGLDLGLHYDVSSRFTLGLAYGYLHMKNKENPNYHFPNMPRHFGVVYAEVRPSNWLKIIPSVEFRGNSYYDTAGEHKNPGYALTNLKLSVTPPSWKYATINVGVENLFNKNYMRYSDVYPSPGRAYFLNLRVDYH